MLRRLSLSSSLSLSLSLSAALFLVAAALVGHVARADPALDVPAALLGGTAAGTAAGVVGGTAVLYGMRWMLSPVEIACLDAEDDGRCERDVDRDLDRFSLTAGTVAAAGAAVGPALGVAHLISHRRGNVGAGLTAGAVAGAGTAAAIYFLDPRPDSFSEKVTVVAIGAAIPAVAAVLVYRSFPSSLPPGERGAAPPSIVPTAVVIPRGQGLDFAFGATGTF